MNEKLDLEVTIIEMSMFYMIATNDIETKYTIKDCTKKLKEEIEKAKDGGTIFYVNKEEHIINRLYSKFTDIKIDEYIKLLEDTILKMNYYYNISRDNSIMSTAIEKDIEELAYNILYFNMGTDELKEYSNIHAEYELGERYLSAEMDKIGYELLCKASEKGHKLASFRRIICIYKGYGTEKNEELAFQELKKYVKEYVYSKAEVLLGKMYFEKEKYTEAFRQFEQMQNWEPSAKFYLGLMYMGGLGVEKDEEEAKNCLIEAVNARNKEAIDYVIQNGLVLTEE